MDHVYPKSRLRPLCAAVCALFAAHAAPISAVLPDLTNYVTSCADDGSAGTLRSQVAAAQANYNNVDLHTKLPLSCSTITLTQGAITDSSGLTMIGPSDRTVTIVGNGSDRLLRIANTLSVQNLTLRGGRSSQALTPGVYGGGCIVAAGASLQNSTVTDCAVTATAANAHVYGGAIYAMGVDLTDSHVTNSVATSNGQLNAGGGIASGADLFCLRSTISRNSLRGTAPRRGGGADMFGSLYMTACTVDNNDGGGITAYSYSSYYCDYYTQICSGSKGNLNVVNSTISGNSGRGGIVQRGGMHGLAIDNSTIVDNSGSGAYDVGVYSRKPMTARSTIFANNHGMDVYLFQASMSGAGNLVRFTNLTSSQAGPGVIVSSDDPLLAPLGYHGGTTRTHALLAGSPAIDKGNNAATLSTDQRGVPREMPAGKADIGAYERQPGDDEVFGASFDGFP